MRHFKIKQIHSDEYGVIRKLDRDAFKFNERNSDGDLKKRINCSVTLIIIFHKLYRLSRIGQAS